MRFFRFLTHPPRAITAEPFQFVLSIFASLEGLALLASGGTAYNGILSETYPLAMVLFWGACLFIGGALALAGRFRHWRAEAGGLALIAATLLLYTVTVLVLHPHSALVTVTNLGYIYACYVRIRVLRLAADAETEARNRDA